MRDVDIWTKGDVITFLMELADKGQIKNCSHMSVVQWSHHAFFPKCTKNWAKEIRANNVTTDITNYGAPSVYSWPECPANCPKFKLTDNLLLSLDPDEDEQEIAATITPEPEAEKTIPQQLEAQGLEGANIVVNDTPIEELFYGKSQQTNDLPYPDKVTLGWLYHKVPMKFWAILITLLLTAAGIGFTLGKIDFFIKVYDLLNK